MENYKFVKSYEMPQGTVPVGSTLLLLNGVIYFDNGMVPETYQAAFINLINREKKSGFNYLRPYTPLFNNV